MSVKRSHNHASKYPDILTALKANAGGTLVLDKGIWAAPAIAIPDNTTVVGDGYGAWLKGRVSYGRNTVLRYLMAGDAGSSFANRKGAEHVLIDNCRIRGGGGADVPVVLLGDGDRSASDIVFKGGEIECNLGTWNNVSVRENPWQGGAHLDGITFDGVHNGVHNGIREGSPRAGFEAWENDQQGVEHHWQNLVIDGCVFEAADIFTIDLPDASRPVPHTHAGPAKVTHNLIKGGGKGGNFAYSLCIECPQNVEVAYNTIWRSRDSAIGLGYHADMDGTHTHGPWFHDNLIDLAHDNGITAPTYGVYLRGESVRFENNLVIGQGAGKTIFKIESLVGCNITGNIVTTNGSTVWKTWEGSMQNVVRSPNTIDGVVR